MTAYYPRSSQQENKGYENCIWDGSLHGANKKGNPRAGIQKVKRRKGKDFPKRSTLANLKKKGRRKVWGRAESLNSRGTRRRRHSCIENVTLQAWQKKGGAVKRAWGDSEQRSFDTASWGGEMPPL